MAAALKVLEIVSRGEVVPALARAGARLMQGLEQAAARHGLQVRCSGPPAMPFMSFANETNFRRTQTFAAACACRGVFFHPHHNWFLCAAHRDEDIDSALAVADGAFAEVRHRFGG
jgi:glutamate-1-semialdehyde 2,1-aminomutase